MRNADAVKLEGFSEWIDLSQSIVHGLAHGFTNRLSALGSSADLMALGDPDFTAEIFLPREIGRLQTLNRVMRLMVFDDESASGQDPVALIRDSMELQAQHGRMQMLESELVVMGIPRPVRVPRSVLLRLFVMLIDRALARQHSGDRSRLLLTLHCEEMSAELEVPDAGRITEYLNAIAGECGATLSAREDAIIVSLPTLKALRAMTPPP